MTKYQLTKRVYSLVWRVGMMVLAVVLDWALVNYTALNIPPQFTVLLGLVLGEVSKAINTELQIRKEIKNLG